MIELEAVTCRYDGRHGGDGETVVAHARGVGDEFDADGVVECRLLVAVERLTDQQGDHRADTLATRERDVSELLLEFRRFDGLDHLRQAPLDALAAQLQILHLPAVCASRAST